MSDQTGTHQARASIPRVEDEMSLKLDIEELRIEEADGEHTRL
jgi:hypothetical protein